MAIGLDEQQGGGLAAVAAGEHVDADAARLQQVTECNYKRSLTRTTCRQIPDADHGLLQPPRRQHAAIEERVSQSGGGTVKPVERIHAEPSRGSRSLACVSLSWSSAAPVLPLPPPFTTSAA